MAIDYLPKCMSRMQNHSRNPEKAIWGGKRKRCSRERTADVIMMPDFLPNIEAGPNAVLVGEVATSCPLPLGT